MDGLRGDIVVARTATAHAALRGASQVGTEDVRVAVELALPHRRRRNPFDESGLTDEQLDEALAAGDEAAGDDDPEPPEPDGSGTSADDADAGDSGPDGATADDVADASGAQAPDSGQAPTPQSERTDPTTPDDAVGHGGQHEGDQHEDASAEPSETPAGNVPGTAPNGIFGDGVFGSPATTSGRRIQRLSVTGIGDGDPGRRSRARSRRGHDIAVTDFVAGGPVHLFGTVLAAAGRGVWADADGASRSAAAPSPGGVRIGPADLRGADRIGNEGNLVVFVVDLSGSMTARKRLAAVADLCVEMLRDSYTRRDRVAVVVARGSQAEVAVPPTKSVDVAVRRLSEVRTGGRTPLAEGLQAAVDLIARAARTEPRRRPLLVVLTDGRATAGKDATARARRVSGEINATGLESVVVDCEQGMIRLGLAADLAKHLGAALIPMESLSVAALGHAGHPAA